MPKRKAKQRGKPVEPSIMVRNDGRWESWNRFDVQAETIIRRAAEVRVMESAKQITQQIDQLANLHKALGDLLRFYDRRDDSGWVVSDIRRLEEIRGMVKVGS